MSYLQYRVDDNYGRMSSPALKTAHKQHQPSGRKCTCSVLERTQIRLPILLLMNAPHVIDKQRPCKQVAIQPEHVMADVCTEAAEHGYTIVQMSWGCGSTTKGDLARWQRVSTS